MIDTLTIVLPTLWVSFTCYLVWYATSAKRTEPITIDDAKMLWKIHKKCSSCTSHKWQPLRRRNGKIQGFKCECGYKYTQKRPLISNMPKSNHQNTRNRAQQQGMLSSGYIYSEY